ncbi:Ubiquitin [Pandoravirus neocaledonia]|uniref:Ubiquitin n=1 Tax=Pandoravirus neocaledonia TaxID=2107708 RepID=A0A2U7UD10_9VIRU|nr:Ubiquitin [Pandoravirus neocaledonia]AVK76323.1 Ubiquitin [Pandoravirus neocaledonia]
MEPAKCTHGDRADPCREPKCAQHRVGDAVTHERPMAGNGSLVLVLIERKPALAVVREVIDSVYRVAPFRPAARCDHPAQQAGDAPDLIEIDMRAGRRGNEGINAPLPACCVCIDAASNCFLWCRCTMPCVCAECARRVSACPQCREPLARDSVPMSPYGWGNIGAIQPDSAKDEMTLSLKMLTGRWVAVKARRNDTVLKVKQAVQDSTGFHPTDQKLNFDGRWLDDRLALSFYRITDKSTVHLVIRLAGD